MGPGATPDGGSLRFIDDPTRDAGAEPRGRRPRPWTTPRWGLVVLAAALPVVWLAPGCGARSDIVDGTGGGGGAGAGGGDAGPDATPDTGPDATPDTGSDATPD